MCEQESEKHEESNYPWLDAPMTVCSKKFRGDLTIASEPAWNSMSSKEHKSDTPNAILWEL